MERGLKLHELLQNNLKDFNVISVGGSRTKTGRLSVNQDFEVRPQNSMIFEYGEAQDVTIETVPVLLLLNALMTKVISSM